MYVSLKCSVWLFLVVVAVAVGYVAAAFDAVVVVVV